MSELPTRLLRETLGAGLTPGSPDGCIDTETLAAWSDGSLSARERAAAESHAASCGRCQALLAAMARTTPAPSSRTWWRPSVFGWLAPLAAAAVALVVWINVPGTPPSHAVPTVQPSPAAPPPSELARQAPQVASPGSAPAEAAGARADASKAEERAKGRAVPPGATTPYGAKADERRAAAAIEPARPEIRQESKAASEGLRDAAVPAPAPVAPLPRAEPAPSNAGVDTTRTVTAAPPAAPLPMPAQPADRAAARAASGFSAQTPAKVVGLPAEIVSPDPKVRWRVVPNGSVLRSIDGGATWQPQATGFVATLTAGSAPSPTTCWIVGAGGIILLSTDGRTWTRVPFPEAVDLVSIAASDAANATVRTADGRTVTTTDGGKIWRPKD
jgi:photosynthesis system II assembly factor YCF48-like protein